MAHTAHSLETNGIVTGIIVACIWNFLLLIFTQCMPPRRFRPGSPSSGFAPCLWLEKTVVYWDVKSFEARGYLPLP